MSNKKPHRTRPGLVLIHGAWHTAACWAPTVMELARQAPDLTVVAVDLPGRGASPGDLRTLTLTQCVDSVVAQIERAGLDEVVVVAHSMGGLTAAGVVAKLGAARVRRVILIAAGLPPAGSSLLDTIPPPFRWAVAWAYRRATPRRPPSRPLARWFFCNGMTRPQQEWVLAQLCDESPRLYGEVVAELPASVPRTWIMPRRDHANPPRKQRAYIEGIGGVDEVIEIDTCHDVMVSEPAKLAEVLAA